MLSWFSQTGLHLFFPFSRSNCWQWKFLWSKIYIFSIYVATGILLIAFGGIETHCSLQSLACKKYVKLEWIQVHWEMERPLKEISLYIGIKDIAYLVRVINKSWAQRNVVQKFKKSTNNKRKIFLKNFSKTLFYILPPICIFPVDPFSCQINSKS